MKVFLSWSGEQSRAVAGALREWLPFINSEITPWMSGTDVEPGARWSSAVAEELEATNFGIVCVTSENQNSAWLNFEAGALAKQLDTSRLVPLAIGLKPTDVKPPLGQFQVKKLTEAGRLIESGLLSLVESLDKRCENHAPDVAEAFKRNWPELKPRLEEALAASETDEERPDRELLEEVLATVRNLQLQPVPSPLAEQLARRAARTQKLIELIRAYAPSTLINLRAGPERDHVTVTWLNRLSAETRETLEDLARRYDVDLVIQRMQALGAGSEADTGIATGSTEASAS